MIYEAARALLEQAHAEGDRLRLLGLTLSGFTGEECQLELGESPPGRSCDAAVDAVRAKYGAAALRRAGADLAPYRGRREQESPEK